MVLEINNDNINEVLSNNVSVLQFSADWCGPCKQLTPTMVALSEENSDVVIGKINVEQNKELALGYNIRSIPVLVFFRDGKEINRIVGAKSKSELQSQIDTLKI